MTRLRSALLWGIAGALTVLVAAQGYRLVASLEVSVGALAGVALLVGAVVTALAYRYERRLVRKGRT